MSRMASRLVTIALPIAAAIAVGSPALAQSNERTGKQVVDAVCIRCHGSGEYGAPKIGDTAAWSKLADRGLSGLSKNAIQGVRQMPPHGGNFTLSDTEIERAITYMVNQSGGHWIEPASRNRTVAERSGKEIVDAQCSKCHAEGKGGAPRIGDRDAWIPRLKPGLDVVVRSAINGHGGMPARGGLANLTDSEIRGAIIYMFSKRDDETKKP
jgi:cytochrome c5